MDILHVIAAAAEPLGVTSLSQEVGISKSAAHRLCQTLMQGRFLAQDPRTGEYRPGPRLFEMTRELLDQLPLAQASRLVVEEMAAAAGHNAFCAALQAPQELVVCQEARVTNAVQPRSLLGLRAGLLEGPGGLACLAAVREEQLEACVRTALQYPRLRGRYSREQVICAVQGLQAQRYVVQVDSPEADLAVVCSVVRGTNQRVVGVVGFCCPMLQRGLPDTERLGALCQAAAERLHEMITSGHRQPTS